MLFGFPIKHTLFICCEIVCYAAGSAAAGPSVNGVSNELAPAPSPGSSGSNGLFVSAGSLIVGLVVASFSSF